MTLNKSSFVLGTVDSLFPDGSAKIKFDGETTTSQKKYKRLASYTPAAGHRVMLAVVSGTYVILGRVI